MHREFWGLNNKPSTSCQWFLCFGTRPRHQTRAPWLGPSRLKKAKSNFFTNRNILHTLKNEPLNIMLLHTSRTVWCLGRVPKHRNQWQEVEGLLSSPQKLSVGAYFELSFLGCGFLIHLSNKSDSPRFLPNSRRQNLIFSQTVISYALLRRNH